MAASSMKNKPKKCLPPKLLKNVSVAGIFNRSKWIKNKNSEASVSEKKENVIN